MVMLGLVAKPKAGKGVVVEALQQDGWTPVSMSGVLRKHMIDDDLPGIWEDLGVLSRVAYHQSAIYYRRRYHPGILAQWSMDAVAALPPENQHKVIIDGIRHPLELDYLRKHSGKDGHFWGIIASLDPDRDREIRRLRLGANPEQRGKGYEGTDTFDWIEYLETEIYPYGSQVGECLRMVFSMDNGTIILNSGQTEEERREWMREIRARASLLEAVSHHPEKGI